MIISIMILKQWLIFIAMISVYKLLEILFFDGSDVKVTVVSSNAILILCFLTVLVMI